MKILDQKGFSLIELMVAGAILAILMSGFASYVYNVDRQQKRIDVKNNINTVRTQIDNTVTDPGSLINSANH